MVKIDRKQKCLLFFSVSFVFRTAKAMFGPSTMFLSAIELLFDTATFDRFEPVAIGWAHEYCALALTALGVATVLSLYRDLEKAFRGRGCWDKLSCRHYVSTMSVLDRIYSTCVDQSVHVALSASPL